jgi:manganese transport protein
VVPLVWFTSSKLKMGRFANSPVLTTTSWIVTSTIVALNGYLLVQIFSG